MLIEEINHQQPGLLTFFSPDNILLYILSGSCQINHTTHATSQELIYIPHTTQTTCTFTSAHLLVFRIPSDILADFIKTNSVFQKTNLYPFMLATQLLLPSTNTYLLKLKILELLCMLDKPLLQQLLQHKTHYRPDITTTVEDNITTPLPLPRLATIAGRSLSSFKRDFHAIYHTSPSKYIREQRLSKAKELLTSSAMPIKDICYILGFESTAHFSRLFKSYFGCSPSSLKTKWSG